MITAFKLEQHIVIQMERLLIIKNVRTHILQIYIKTVKDVMEQKLKTMKINTNQIKMVFYRERLSGLYAQ
ncbi:MAG: hypothetical protein EOP45_21260 [Sphingobacteriaceae bacterium]|nr:MAG: hypothetical protein EOP45_21260 [Sphingobacteriaceae bacterium]